MTLDRLRETTLLWIVGLYLILNAGFMQLRIPPGGTGVPLGDIVMLLALATISHTRVVPLFARNLFLLPFLVWWGLGIGRALLGFGDYGMWSLRDALHVIESLFLYVGFAFALRPSNIERYYRWLPIVLTIAGIYALGAPISETLQTFSPSVTAAAGYERTVLFQYQAFYTVVMWAIAYLLIFRAPGSGARNFILAGILLAYLAIFLQARTLYMQIFVLSLVFILFRPKAFGKSTIMIALGAIVLALLPALQLEIKSRFGENMSLDLLLRHFMSSFGEAQKGVEGAASGVDLRYFWWAQLLRQVTANVTDFLFGLGYGFPLVELPGAAVEIREPHNSYISIISRIGVIGLGAFFWMHVLLMRVWIRAYRECRRMSWRLGQDRLLVVLCYILMIWVLAFTEDGFEKPFVTIPYYFSWGIVCAFAHNLRMGAYVPLRAGNRQGVRSSVPRRLGGSDATSSERPR